MKSFLFVLLISTVLINGVWSIVGDDCAKATNTSCEACLKLGACAFCKKSRECFPRPATPHTSTCPISDLQFETCVADAETLLIVLGCVGAVVLIVIIVLICCICRKCKQRSVRKEIKSQYVNEQRLEERRAAAEIRSAERREKDDQIRMKYGLTNDASVEYRRMS